MMRNCHSENKLAEDQELRSGIMGLPDTLIQYRQGPRVSDRQSQGDHRRQQLDPALSQVKAAI